MAGILPDSVNGGLIKRDTLGNCLFPVNVVNAYCPPAGFTTTCDITALPSDCTARITAAQINAIVSEMLSLAVALTPTGTWSCNSVTNLASAFTAWGVANSVVDGSTIVGAGTTTTPWSVSPTGVSNRIAATPAAVATLMLALNLKNCAGGNHAVGAVLPTCAEMTAAISAAIAALPADKFLQGLQSYDATSNVMTLLMSDGSTVPVDMTALIADAVNSVASPTPTSLASSLAFVDQCGLAIAPNAVLQRSGAQAPVIIEVARGATTAHTIVSNPALASPTAGVVTVASDPNFYSITNNFCTPALLHLVAHNGRIAIELPAASRTQSWSSNAQFFDTVVDNTGKQWGSSFSHACDDITRTISFDAVIVASSSAILAPGETRTFSRSASYFNGSPAGHNISVLMNNLPGLTGWLLPL